MFKLRSHFAPKGDQPKAISHLVKGIKEGKKKQILLGVTGSGKTFTIANIIQDTQKPTLIIAHNKALAAQLYQEFKSFFPDNFVEFFVSYYDYYQPEVYIPRTETYIEKSSSINDQIDRMRLSATRALLERKDVIIISSVSCIYSLGDPKEYKKKIIQLHIEDAINQETIMQSFRELSYQDTSIQNLRRGTFFRHKKYIEIHPGYADTFFYQIWWHENVISHIYQIDLNKNSSPKYLPFIKIYPNSHHFSAKSLKERGIQLIEEELKEQRKFFLQQNAFTEEQRICNKTKKDLELIKETNFCKGFENYSRHFSHRKQGEPPPCLLDFFPKDFLLFIDESHQTIPQIRAMYHGDRSRKEMLVKYGFRLPSAYDNRPLTFEEFQKKINQTIYVSATPGKWETQETNSDIIEQIIRPTGLLDPKCEIRPIDIQIDDCIEEIHKEIRHNNKVLIITLTKKQAEQLSSYLQEIGIKAQFLHSGIETISRIQLIKDLREGPIDVLIGINLLKEGLDLPEVSLVCILDADKEGFLRNTTSLIQICGRAARNIAGRVIFYTNTITQSIQSCIETTDRRRSLQEKYNKDHHIIPQTIQKKAMETLLETFHCKKKQQRKTTKNPQKIEALKKSMEQAAKEFRFSDAAKIRDKIKALSQKM